MLASVYRSFPSGSALCMISLVVAQLASAFPSEHHHAHHAHVKRQESQASGTASWTSTACVTHATQFPSPSAWISAEELMSLWVPIYQDTYKDSDDEVKILVGDTADPLKKGAIFDGANGAGMDPRFIAAIIGAESHGETTVGGGLMQSGATPCASHTGCTADLIKAQIDSGMKVAADCQSRYGKNYANIARCFNTGHVPPGDDMTVTTDDMGTHGMKAYVDRIANFLLGMDFNHQPDTLCTLGIGT